MDNFDYLEEWCKENKLSYSFPDPHPAIIEIAEFGKFLLLYEKEDKLFNSNFELIIAEDETRALISFQIKYVVYNFGGIWYYDKVEEVKKPQLNLFKYIGKCNHNEIDFIPLGIHGKYEILNGSRDYIDWCKKALFFGYKSLGICEKNTLAGTISFQLDCDKAGIKSILGEQITIKKEDYFIEGKVYVKNEEGWRNLLLINTEINVKNVEEKFIEEDELLKLGKGLYFVFVKIKHITYNIINKYSSNFESLFFQIDSVIWDNDKTDQEYLSDIQLYLTKYFQHLPPILINDSYYLDKEHNHIKGFLNKVGNYGFVNTSKNQYFKDIDDNVQILSKLFSNEDKFLYFLEPAISNTLFLGENCNFKIETGVFKLPKFEIKELPEKYLKFSSNEELFENLIYEGLNDKIKKNNLTQKEIDLWKERIVEELRVIKLGKYVDYFLILWDIIRWCRENEILVGVGRGSAGGSLISYLLDITKVDPIKFKLLFERFMSEGRVKKSMPDIDTDFEGDRRDEVKRYMERRYGEEYVCSVGTYTSLQLKQALKDLGKSKGVSFSSMNYLTQTLELQDWSWKDIFRTAVKKSVWKEFIQQHTNLINDIPLCLHQPKATSIHPCATIILPKKDNFGNPISIFNQIPVRKVGEVLVSEWEGEELANAGYLKEDILGIKQLDKFREIINLIAKTTGEKIDIYNISLDEKGVYDLFKGGYNCDCFHFGSTLLKAYSREVLPEDIEELIAMIALVRPGATQSGAQYDYINYKFGRKQPEYDFGIREITKNTYGLYIYQEQIMQICQVLGGFTLSEAEDVRKAMGKLRRDILEPFEQKFIDGAIKKNCNPKEAKKIWDKMVGFADYGFNRAHAASYAITGYISQYLKYKYPLHFWTIAFQYADDDKVISYISEINKTDNFIKIVPPDINNSRDIFWTDFKTGKIYWSLIKIYSLGLVAVKEIIEERNKNGIYFSLEEFYKRVAKSKVGKNVVENLILSGSFDDIEGIQTPQQRLDLIFKYYDIAGVKEKDYNLLFIEEGIDREYWWVLRQKEASGLGYFDYKKIISESSIKHLTKNYCDEGIFFNTYSENKKVVIGGIILEILERNSKQGKFAQITIDCNNELILINYWSKLWVKDKKRFDNSIGKILLISGRIAYNSYSKFNALQIEDDVELEVLE